MEKNKTNRNIYKQAVTSKSMQAHIDIPEYLNNKLKYEKLNRKLSNIQETILSILNEYFEKNDK